MEHTDIDRTLAVERYLLGEISGTELDEFEEHIFSCPQCAEDVRTGAAFYDNARAVFRDEAERQATPAPARVRRWWDRFTLPVLAPAFAALLLLCIGGYQRLVEIPGLRQQLANPISPRRFRLSPFPAFLAARSR